MRLTVTNVIDWLRASAEFMAKDRPDVFKDTSSALDTLSQLKALLDNQDGVDVVSTAGFELSRAVEDEGVVGYRLTRVISSATIFEQEEQVVVYGWTPEVNLPYLGNNNLSD